MLLFCIPWCFGGSGSEWRPQARRKRVEARARSRIEAARSPATVRLADGSERTFLEDGDEVVLRGGGLGEVRGRILPA